MRTNLGAVGRGLLTSGLFLAVGMPWAGTAAQPAAQLVRQRRAVPEDAIALRRIEDLAWSPDGKSLTFTVVTADTARRRWLGDIWIWDERGARSLVSTTAHERNARWSADGRWIAFLSDADSTAQLWTTSPGGGDGKKVTSAPEGVGDFDWLSDGSSIAFTGAQGRSDVLDSLHPAPVKSDPIVVGAGDRSAHLWVVDVATRKVTEHAHLDGALSSPSARPGSDDILVERRPTSRANDADLSDLLLVSPGGRVSELTAGNAGSDWSARWSADGSAFVYLTNAPNANTTDIALHVMGAGSRAIPALSGYDASSPEIIRSRSRDGARLIVSSTVGRGVTSRVWTTAVGPNARGIPWTRDSVVVEAASWSPDMARLATVESSPVTPRELYVRRIGRDGKLSGEGQTSLNRVSYAIGATRVVRWKAADGIELEGILVLPPAFVAGSAPLPTLVRVHGGPYGKYDFSFDPFAQMLAGRGYALFEPNYRGSEGYGEAFSQLVRGDYGGGNHGDILVGLDALIARGIADSTRLGIFGWSFGGFSTNWALTQTDRFAVGVAGAGMSNMLSHYGTSDIQRYREYMSYGSPWDSSAARYLWDRSPIRLANAVRAPLLLLHGESDRRVAISQAEELYTALKRLGRTVQLVRYPREPHTFREPLHQVDRDRRIADWFDTHLKR